MNPFDGAEVISSYSRTQAIEDGVLVDVSDTAREAGIKFPVALTVGVFGKCVQVPEGVECQDVAGRLWDVVSLLRFAIRAARPGSDRVEFTVSVNNGRRERVRLWSLCGPGDDAEPVITVMLEGED